MTSEQLLRALTRPICVVGNGTPLRPLGRDIDAHVSVIRINNFRVAGFEELVGTKTTVRCTSGWKDIENRNEHPEFSPFTADAKESANIAAYALGNYVDILKASTDVHPLCAELGIKQPSTGLALLVLFELLEIPVTVACFDGFRTPHYWERKKGETIHVPHEAEAIAMLHCTTIIGDEREQQRQLLARASSANADRSKKRPYEVEKYLYQFQHQQGAGGGGASNQHDRYVDGWERTFGKKEQR